MPARFKLDETLPRDAEAFLRKAGHYAQTVLGEHLVGAFSRVGHAAHSGYRGAASSRGSSPAEFASCGRGARSFNPHPGPADARESSTTLRLRRPSLPALGAHGPG